MLKMNVFKNPGNEYRLMPFWSWNETIDKDRIDNQIIEMKEQKLGGFFIHSRIGLETPYLSEEWMEKVEYSVNLAKENKLEAWLYDEDKWPSGYGGGVVPLQDIDFRMKALLIREAPIESKEEENVKLLRIMEHDQKSYYFYEWIVPLGDKDWFNGTSYIDTLNPKAVEAFIESTHEKYKKVVGQEFGKTIPGMFTDESNNLFHIRVPKPAIQWTTNFPELFLKEYGYSILDHLISLFKDVNDYQKVRYHYWKLVCKLYTTSYAKQTYDWCQENNLIYTGHYMGEDTLQETMKWIGWLMPLYEYMDYPGMDHLGRKLPTGSNEKTWTSLLTIRQVTSVANQLGKKRSLSEMYGCAGQNFTLEDAKWTSNWHFVNGINFVNPHLSLFSMKGERKRDFPPNLFYQQPYWKYFHLLSDYNARLSYALSQGKKVVRVLIIHPMESAWTLFNPLEENNVDHLSRELENLSLLLLQNQIEFDFGDEEIISKHGKVKGDKFVVGDQEYDSVLIPSLETIRSYTVILTSIFHSNGGKVFKLKEDINRVDGEIVENNPLQFVDSTENIETIVSQLVQDNPISIKSRNGAIEKSIWSHHRKLDESDVYFFCNTSKTEKLSVEIQLTNTSKKIAVLDLETGDMHSLPFSRNGENIFIDYTFSPCEGFLIIAHEHSGENPSSIDNQEKSSKQIHLNDEWELKAIDENAITFDLCKVITKDNKESSNLSVIDVQTNFNSGEISKLLFEFTIDGPSEDITFDLVIEDIGEGEIMINGNKCGLAGNGYWIDESFTRFTLENVHLIEGVNRIELIPENVNASFEPIYLVGNFEVYVDGSNKIVKSTSTEAIKGNLVEQGYPFFSGKATLSQEFFIEDLEASNQAYLKIEKQDAVVSDVFINGKHVKSLVWQPLVVDITPYLIEGKNTIGITIVNSLHNLLGPHHLGEEVLFCTPNSFRENKNENWTTNYFFVPFQIGSSVIEIY